MSIVNKFPANVKTAAVLTSLALIVLFIYLGQTILFPIVLALLLAILLRPVVKFLKRKLKFPHVVAVAFAVVLTVLIMSGLVMFVSWQINDIAHDIDKIKANLTIHIHNIQFWIKQRFHLTYLQQNSYLKEATKNGLANGNIKIGNTLGSFTSVLLNLTLIPIYTFLILLYRNHFLKFLFKVIKKENHKKLLDVLFNVKFAIQSFLLGLITEMGMVATLTGVGYMIIGAHYAVLLGVITGILNLIPYVGILVAGLLSIIVTLTSTTDLSMIIGVIVVNVIVQFIDNNFLVPLVVSSKVQINALVSLSAIIVAGAIAGVSGMFLAIPILAILKVIFDRLDFLEPWGYLIGDDLPKTSDWGKIKLTPYDAGDSDKIDIAGDKNSKDLSEGKSKKV